MKANAIAFIDLFPQKFDTNVGEFGSQLSGGQVGDSCHSKRLVLIFRQRQRVAIARAFARDEKIKILLLDEVCGFTERLIILMVLQPTSALDQLSEHFILKSLTELRKSAQRKTCVVVAHRLSTIEDADVIFVLRSGEIVEQGTYEKLLALQGMFYDLVCQQMNAT